MIPLDSLLRLQALTWTQSSWLRCLKLLRMGTFLRRKSIQRGPKTHLNLRAHLQIQLFRLFMGVACIVHIVGCVWFGMANFNTDGNNW